MFELGEKEKIREIFIYLTIRKFLLSDMFGLSTERLERSTHQLLNSCCFLSFLWLPVQMINWFKNSLGYWNSVGGVRFWVIARLWWFWCMTSFSGIVVVPVKNMFWLRLGAAHPKLCCECFCFRSRSIANWSANDDDVDWWMMMKRKKINHKIKST